MTGARRYADPYVAGVGLGLVLLLAFLLVGRGLGASGAFATVVRGDENPARDWLVVEMAGVAIGAALSARLAGRARVAVDGSESTGARRRVLHAVVGGIVMAFGARLARGCTSGLGLSGGATLSAGAWLFVLAAFAAAFAAAPLVRRVWR
jgi:uncharacterized membrane protein YedE/YeeE